MVAQGTCRAKNGMVKVVCLFDPETFKEIQNIAISEKTSMAETIRTLTENALEDRR